MSRIQHTFGQSDDAKLIFYLNAGDPTLPAIPDLMLAMRDGGVDIIELGYPFCDPILDGPALQRANQRALSSGGGLAQTLNCVETFREHDKNLPIILMGYSNPIYAFGFNEFAQAAKQSGADGVIMADMPLEEAYRSLLPALHSNGLCFIPLGAPSLGEDHVKSSEPGVGGFLYCIPSAGPTGGAAPALDTVRHQVSRWRGLSDLPIGVGFGVKTPEAAAEIGKIADAVIVGTAFVEFVQACWHESGHDVSEMCTKVTAYCREFRAALS